MRYLGKKLGLYPKKKEQEEQAVARVSFITDLIVESRLVFHARCFSGSYYT